MSITETQNQKSKIDEMKSWYDEYIKQPRSAGRLMHYIYCICGLKYADSVTFHGNGIVTLDGKPFAIADYDKGYPYFKFASEYAYFQSKQDELLSDK